MEKRSRIGRLGLVGGQLTALALLVTPTAEAAGECALDQGETVAVPEITVSYKPLPGPIRSGEFFELDVAVCAADGAPGNLRSVEATMPAHGHGMNYKPEVTQTAPGRFKAEGLMFHMTGTWRLRFDVEAGGARKTVMSERMVEQ